MSEPNPNFVWTYDGFHEPPWMAAYSESYGGYDVTTDRGDPSDEYSVSESAFDEKINRLWAAAPELYYVVAQVAAVGDIYGLPADLVTRARAAIAKADYRDGRGKHPLITAGDPRRRPFL